MLQVSVMERVRQGQITTLKKFYKREIYLKHDLPTTIHIVKKDYMNLASTTFVVVVVARIQLYFGVWFPSQSLCLTLPSSSKI